MSNDAAALPPFAYIGCYTGGSNARGISVYHYDATSNALSLVSIVAPVASPSFIALDPTRKFLYSGNESGSGSASSFSINPLNGLAHFSQFGRRGRQAGAGVAVHPSGKFLITANYTGGTSGGLRNSGRWLSR